MGVETEEARPEGKVHALAAKYVGDFFEFRAISRVLERLGTELTKFGHS